MNENPFPGMNPWLEYPFGDVHAAVTVYASDQLQPRLPQELVARIEEYEGPSMGDDKPATLRSIRIMDIAAGYRIVTLIEFVHLISKQSEAGREQLCSRQANMLTERVNLVEIDLLRVGSCVLTIPQLAIPKEHREPYRVCVVRGKRPHVAEVWPVSLREPLPTIPIPLREHDAEIQLQLQPLIESAYLRGRYYQDTDYREDPVPPLTGPDVEWADQSLREKGLR